MQALGTFDSTAYGPPWGGINGTGITAGGTPLYDAPEKYIVAVDPSSIALGTWLRIQPNPFGTSEPFLADDTGGAIVGNRIDFYDWRGRESQYAWGRRSVKVWKLDSADEAASSGDAPASGDSSTNGGGAAVASSSGELLEGDARSGALKALLTVALVLGGASLAWMGFGQAFGVNVSPRKLLKVVPATKAASVGAG